MSMLCSFYRLTEKQTSSLLAQPELVSELLGNTPLPPKSSFLSKLFVKSNNNLSQRLEPVPESETFELNQAWHVLHYLLSGSDAEGDWPSVFIMSGGREVGSDLGYGPARLLTRELLKEVVDFLASQSIQSLDDAYVAQRIEDAKIYWRATSEPEGRQRQIEELWSIVAGMRSFFEETIQLRGSILVQIY